MSEEKYCPSPTRHVLGGFRGLSFATVSCCQGHVNPSCQLRSPLSPGYPKGYWARPLGLKIMTGNGLSKSKLLILVTRGSCSSVQKLGSPPTAFSEPYLPASLRDSAQGSCVSTAISSPSAFSQKHSYTFYLNSACLSSLPAYLFFPRVNPSFHLPIYSSICVSIRPPWHPPSECSINSS